MEKGLTIIIPSKSEKFLYQTTLEVINKAKSNVECLVILDGYDIPEEEVVKDPRVRYIKRPFQTHDLTKRQGINEAVEQASYDYVMALDAHCILGEGYDKTILEETNENEVTILRRESLDAQNWKLYRAEGRPPVDYEYFIWQFFLKGLNKEEKGGLHGYRWDERTRDRINILKDETLTFQASQWAMSKRFYKECGLMQIEGYTGWGAEANEISLKALQHGGKCYTLKNNFYCHLHKGRTYGRMYKVPLGGIHSADFYSFDQFVNKNRKIFVDLIERFWPIPNWNENWQSLLKKI